MNSQCPYCRAALDGAPVRYCSTCGTPHHADCWTENGGCTVFGCASSPPEEAKLHVGQSDIGSVPIAPPPGPPAGYSTPPPPPPSAGGSAYPAPPPYPSQPQSYPPPPPPYAAPGYAQPVGGYYAKPPKTRIGFIMLGIFLGAFGAHNFYAGYKGKAIAQLLITLLSVFILSPVTAIWAIVEVCIVDRDADNVPMT